MIEIEVKARLKEPDKIFHKLENMGCVFSEKITEIRNLINRIKYLAISFPASLSPGLQPGDSGGGLQTRLERCRKIPENFCPSTYINGNGVSLRFHAPFFVAVLSV